MVLPGVIAGHLTGVAGFHRRRGPEKADNAPEGPTACSPGSERSGDPGGRETKKRKPRRGDSSFDMTWICCRPAGAWDPVDAKPGAVASLWPRATCLSLSEALLLQPRVWVYNDLKLPEARYRS
jgi:hypothetical protein